MNANFWLLAATLLGLAAIAFLSVRFLRPFHWRAAVALGLVWVGLLLVGNAAYRYSQGQEGFKLGVDLAGGTILVYEVDTDRQQAVTDKDNAVDKNRMIEFLKRRIDPNGLLEVSVRPVGDTRFEVILPFGGAHQAAIDRKRWDALIADVKAKPEWKDVPPNVLEVGQGQVNDLTQAVAGALDAANWKALGDKLKAKYPQLGTDANFKYDGVPVGNRAALADAMKGPTGKPVDELRKAIDEAYKPTSETDIRTFIDGKYSGVAAGGKQNASAEQVQRIKETIGEQGSLEFRVLAFPDYSDEDRQATQAAEAYFKDAASDTQKQDELANLAKKGLPPPKPTGEDKKALPYTWVELSKQYRNEHGLGSDKVSASPLGLMLAAAREKGEPYRYSTPHAGKSGQTQGSSGLVYYSRKCENSKLSSAERARKQYDYFVLALDPALDDAGQPKSITGDSLVSVDRAEGQIGEKGVSFRMNGQGANRFGEMTTSRKPAGSVPSQRFSMLAIVLDGQLISSASLNEPITGGQGQITGGFTEERITQLIAILRAGALPATLKPLPVSENTIGPTLGGDTIFKGSLSIAIAFGAVLLFMLWYYRTAGVVACIALLANLLLTVAFMVLVDAAFTLPGLAGLVLMLGMAVDANVLIYERMREERERGAGLILALRNGYDRALPTILDTHLTSFFTAVVLYAVGNDQLRGFGISLAAGLVISLYTSLVMTRLMFDFWQAAGKLRDLRFHQLFQRPNIDFMAIRHYWFAATLILTVLGLGVFLLRGEKGLNIDFVGGTAYAGQLKEDQARTIGQLRELLGKQDANLKVTEATQRDETGNSYELEYADGEKITVKLANAEKDKKKVIDRAKVLPDWSVEQLFPSSQISDGLKSGESRYFTIRSTEREASLVQTAIYRLLREGGKSLLKSVELLDSKIDGRTATLTFSDFASPAYLKSLLIDEFKSIGLTEASPFEVRGEGASQESRFKTIKVDVTSGQYDPARDQAKLQGILDRAKTTFAARPQPERLENFDAQLAAETSSRAVYAILASWVAILLFLWFRFGNWTYGAATVLCLIHDLCFTLGIIAFSHYVVHGVPWLAHLLQLEDFKIDLPTVAALLTLVGYSVSDTIVVFDRIREVKGKSPVLTPQMINDSVNQTLGRTILASLTVFLVVAVLYFFGGEGVHLFAFVMVVGVIVGTYSSIYIAAPLLLIFGDGTPKVPVRPGAAVPAKV